MSQSLTQREEESTVASDIDEIIETVEAIDVDQLEEMADENLVETRTKLKELEDISEEVRKERADDVLEDRIEPGDRLYGLQRVKSHKKYVDEDPGTVIMRAVSQGINYTEFVDINASELADVAPEIADIGRYEYTYFR